MTLFSKWMKANQLTIVNVVYDSGLNKNTVAKLRSSENDSELRLSTLLKLKKAYNKRIDLKEVFPTFKYLVSRN